MGHPHAFGAAGAGLASTLAVAIGVVFLWFYFVKLEHYVAFNSTPMATAARNLETDLEIGLPAGGEMLMIFLVVASSTGPCASSDPPPRPDRDCPARHAGPFRPCAGSCIRGGARGGTEFGAGQPDRVRETFRAALWRA